jgi:DNA mismatch repair protein MSH5
VNLRPGEHNGPRITFVIPGDVVESYDDGENTASGQGQLLRLVGWIDMDSRLTVSLTKLELALLKSPGWMCRGTSFISAA